MLPAGIELSEFDNDWWKPAISARGAKDVRAPPQL